MLYYIVVYHIILSYSITYNTILYYTAMCYAIAGSLRTPRLPGPAPAICALPDHLVQPPRD